MSDAIHRRDLMKMAGMGSLIFVSGLGRVSAAEAPKTPDEGFTFLQLTDTHIGFNDPKINPDFAGTLSKAIASINKMDPKPDFVIFTGDLSHNTDDDKERRSRLADFREIVKPLSIKDVHYMPGEHDAGLDNGEAWHEAFGKSIYTFEYKGVHFIALDNVSDPRVQLGDDQLQWLSADLAKQGKDAPIVVFTHRPLFDLYPVWDWYTRDGAKAIDILMPYSNVTVFYGHIHQVNYHMEGHIPLHAGNSLMFPLPAKGSQPQRAPVPWDAAHPYEHLSYRRAEARGKTTMGYALVEYPMAAIAAGKLAPEPEPAMESTAAEAAPKAGAAPQAASGPKEQVIEVTAKRFEFNPKEITVKQGTPVLLKLTSLDRLHGFNCPDLGIRSDIEPGKVNELRFTPTKAGTFTFFCDVYCGSGHGGMNGKIIVTP